MTVEQILWNLTNAITGVDPVLVSRGVRYGASAAGLCVLWVCLVFFLVPLWRFVKSLPQRILAFVRSLSAEKIARVLPILLVAAAIWMLIHDVRKAESRIGLRSFLQGEISTPAKDFIAQNYWVPNVEDIQFGQKKNLVVVMNESLESSFALPEVDSLPKLSQFAAEHESVPRHMMATGTNWTIGALTGWHFGLPLKLPSFVNGNEYHSRRGFLPGALSIFDVLRKNGYETVLVMGSDANFSGMRALFSTHGGFEIKDRAYWTAKGDFTAENKGTGWGFNDRYVLRRAKEEFERLRKAGKPFVLFVQTIDTHGPEGFCPANERRLGDMRDVVRWTDRLTAEFAQGVLESGVTHTALAVMGDHWLGYPVLVKSGAERHVYNAFAGDVPPIPREKKRELITTVDIAPTLLQAAGARWGSDRFGLGVSLFSPEPSLAQKMGPDAFNRALGAKSKFYGGFY